MTKEIRNRFDLIVVFCLGGITVSFLMRYILPWLLGIGWLPMNEVISK